MPAPGNPSFQSPFQQTSFPWQQGAGAGHDAASRGFSWKRNAQEESQTGFRAPRGADKIFGDRKTFAWNQQFADAAAQDNRGGAERGFKATESVPFARRDVCGPSPGFQEPFSRPSEPAKRQQQQPSAAAPPPGQLSGERVYEIVATTGTVRAEPDVKAKMKTKKSRGARFICSEVTVNGWLKLAKEPGWILAQEYDVRTGDVTEVASLAADQVDVLFGLPQHQPQGISCFEVVFNTGVSVRASPDREAQSVTTLMPGEYVFADRQNFNGWLRMLGDKEGWLLPWSPDWGQLLRPRPGVSGIDLWALSTAWVCARQRPGVVAAGSLGRSWLSAKDVKDLKKLEEQTSKKANEMFEASVLAKNNHRDLVAKGFFMKEDIAHGENAMLRKLFGVLLAQTAQDGGESWLRNLLPNFVPTKPRVPALPGDEEMDLEDEGPAGPFAGMGGPGGAAAGTAFGNPLGGLGADGLGTAFDPLDTGAFEGMVPFEFDGRRFVMSPHGIIFDPPNQVPMGCWNAEHNRIEPVVGSSPDCDFTVLSSMGKTYLLSPDDRLLDPETDEVLGMYDQDTCEVRLFNEKGKEADGEIPIYDPVFDNDDDPADPNELLERGIQTAKQGLHKAAVSLFTEALTACGKQRTVDLEFECEILRARCASYAKLGRYKDLLEDADRIVANGGADEKAIAEEVREWRRQAEEGASQAPSGGAGNADRGDPSEAIKSAVASVQSQAPPTADPASLPQTVPAPPRRPASQCPNCSGVAARCQLCGVGMETCGNCGKFVTKANCCSGCHCTYYCNQECQRAHWKREHKKVCKTLASLPRVLQ